ncbi:hypothetical protein [Maribacter sp.]|uniref:hypothetical protein n=1 Tax=Maribacter sp. TaxID=1897614 RepID=UPI0025C06F62|nr:hypothetical protein [Maribacter sp.]
MAEKLDYKAIAIQAGITAIVFAAVNKIFTPTQNAIGLAEKAIAFMPIEHQAKFADSVTVENARDNKWLAEQLSNLDPNDPNIYKDINKTSIGNSAYIALYGSHEGARKKSLRILNNIKTQLA